MESNGRKSPETTEAVNPGNRDRMLSSYLPIIKYENEEKNSKH